MISATSLLGRFISYGLRLLSEDEDLAQRTKDGLFHTSRYLSEFDEISPLGRGTYGKVFKVKNKLDGQDYSVKKILIKNVTKYDFMKIHLPLCLLYQLLNHHHRQKELLRRAPVDPSSFLKTLTVQQTLSDNKRAELLGETCPALQWESSTVLDESYADMSSQLCAENHSKDVQYHLMLYIQMQLCERSLKDWIQERNATQKLDLSTGSFLPVLLTLEGVEYIHSRGIMHRDLKPRNIFLHGHECLVKIGDFSLSCTDIVMNENEELSSHTTGVGTIVYASPEQLQGSHYDSKSDMYSVGVIAVELFQSFGTEMERVQTLRDLRKGMVPDDLYKNWLVLIKKIKLLTILDPSKRPNASQLLYCDLFNNKDQVTYKLQQRVSEQAEKISQLRRQISELQTTKDGPEKASL
ncbi:LOW QUALITY PROTEIN: eukaryotic translation initiation factor 2-alpha kinase 1-like [Silurus meridionalis]|uniref:LOW QUALITY PROTEIN: eukaryotic translation initiation factor 2-alpha kinase 1-like n=1 Tax=Silurus meridionalis TaxID=175797 RepID=UPI001EE9FCA1|nr:LOW QUALITY PROTEIN: eukaryotic translation initiation factor 2-alpha kinase 1-like [Silurus meridionalis]